MIKIYVDGKVSQDKVGTIKIFNCDLTLDESKLIREFTYDHEITFGHDFKKIVLSDGIIYSKLNKNGRVILKRDDGAVIELENFDNPTLNMLLNKKLVESFNNLFNRIRKEEPYTYVYLTAGLGKSEIGYLNKSSFKNGAPAIFCQIELDEENKLTELGEQTLALVLNKEFREWFNIFLTNNSDNNFKVCYDDKIMVVNNNLVKYVKPQALKMEQVCLNTLEKLNVEKR